MRIVSAILLTAYFCGTYDRCECDRDPRFESAVRIELLPPPYPRKRAQFMGTEMRFNSTQPTLNAPGCSCKSVRYRTDPQVMGTQGKTERPETWVTSWRRRTNQYPAPVLDLQVVSAATPVLPPAHELFVAPMGGFPRGLSRRSCNPVHVSARTCLACCAATPGPDILAWVNDRCHRPSYRPARAYNICGAQVTEA
jgi:hypothetical protein